MSLERAEQHRHEPERLLADIVLAAEAAPSHERRLHVELDSLAAATGVLLDAGAGFVGVFASEAPEPSVRALLAFRGDLVVLRAALAGARAYPSLARLSPGALLPERELHDETGVVPLGHPQLEPALRPDADVLPRRVTGPETFAIAYGPIRSGVFEAIQYSIDTGGEDVLAVTVRPYFKRRRLEARFAGLGLDHAAHLAERIAGPAAVAHAIAFAEAVERASGIEAPSRAQRWRVVHAELERIANHLDVAAKLAEDAALAVGVARFGALKEQTMRLRARLCGSRFGRGVVVPGGVRSEPLLPVGEVLRAVDVLEGELRRDRRLLMRTTSFTDRLIGAGPLDATTVHGYGGVGPVARACSLGVDARLERPYGAYGRLGFRIATGSSCDAMARLEVRLEEVDQSLHLIRQALQRLDRLDERPAVGVPSGTGDACGWAEAPAGELTYWVALDGGAVRELRIVPPSLRNWPLFAESFRGDVLTDFSFIEHSFGLTQAGADR